MQPLQRGVDFGNFHALGRELGEQFILLLEIFGSIDIVASAAFPSRTQGRRMSVMLVEERRAQTQQRVIMPAPLCRKTGGQR